MEFIKLIEKDQEVWYGRLNEKGQYVSDLPTYYFNGETGKDGIVLFPAETHTMTLEEMIEDDELTIIAITPEEYWNQANALLAPYYDDEIESLKRKIKELEIKKVKLIS